jgi:hypothetical protein
MNDSTHDIESWWTFRTGRWDDNNGFGYVDIKERRETRTLTLQIVERGHGKRSLQFVGGPTGYESYDIDDLLDPKTGLATFGPNPEDAMFCICGGTMNSWPTCEVRAKDVLDYLLSQGYGHDT